MGAGSAGVAFLAGVLSTLSPCVLPILPLVISGAAAAHRFGPLALAAGLAGSFTVIGLFVATIGFAIGLDDQFFRVASAVVLTVMGVVLLSGALQQRLAVASGGVGDLGSRVLGRLSPAGLGGQFLVGGVLGAVWSPCVGPTLGAASVLAAQGRELVGVAGVMLAFGLGAAGPLLLISVLSRQALLRWRGRMLGVGRTGKTLLGAGALVVAGLVLTGLDHRLEALVVDGSPAWLTDLTTRF